MANLIILKHQIPDFNQLFDALDKNITALTLDHQLYNAKHYEPELTTDVDSELNTFINSLHPHTNTLALLYQSFNTGMLPVGFEQLLMQLPSHITTIDLLTCNINSPNVINTIKSYETKYNFTIRYSIDLTGHSSSMGDWILESHNVAIKNLYFNQNIDEWNHVLVDATNFTAAVSTASDTTGVVIYQGGVFTSGKSHTDVVSVVFKANITNIGFKAFQYCTKLTSITIPASVTTIGTDAFYYCLELTNVTFEEGSQLASIGDNAFYFCYRLISITIPASVTSIGGSAFYYCPGLTSITIPASVTSIGVFAFKDCSGLTNVTFDSDSQVTSIKDKAFYGCIRLTSITIPDSVTTIGVSAFDGCIGLTSITIPDSVTSIGEDAFKGYTGLTSITVPDSVTSIGNYEFQANATAILSQYNILLFSELDADTTEYSNKIIISAADDVLSYNFTNCTLIGGKIPVDQSTITNCAMIDCTQV